MSGQDFNVAYRQHSSPGQLVGSSDRGTRARAEAPRATSYLCMDEYADILGAPGGKPAGTE